MTLSNKQIANHFDQLAKILELHDENPYRIKSFASAYINIRNLNQELHEMTVEEITSVKGIGSKTSAMIQEIISTGSLQELEIWKAKTPADVVEMLQIKGIGPKKVKVIWKEMQVETIGELLYACNENRLIHYPGFGEKTQLDIKTKLEYHQASRGKYLFASVEHKAEMCLQALKSMMPEAQISLIGDVKRMMPIVTGIELLTDQEPADRLHEDKRFRQDENRVYFEEIPVTIHFCDASDFHKTLFKGSCSGKFLEAFTEEELNNGEEIAIFKAKNSLFIPPEYRENPNALSQFNQVGFRLIEMKDIKGVIHNHSTWSDGMHTLEAMADHVHSQGFQYFVISDHSKTAFYAKGLKEEDVLRQWEAIDIINTKYSDGFKVFKGIESDILTDGSLDYTDELLAGFDVVIASVHSVLNMDEEKATTRLLKAIENPYTDILGHPTGRLLLSRPGYPIDHKKIIDACAANQVAIELNANPQRLDIDWTWIPYALEKGVLIAINPDAHSIAAIDNIRFGVITARKGGLYPDACLNTFNRTQFEQWMQR